MKEFIIQKIADYLQAKGIDLKERMEIEKRLADAFDMEDKEKILVIFDEVLGDKLNGLREAIKFMLFEHDEEEPIPDIDLSMLIRVAEASTKRKNRILKWDKNIDYDTVKEICRKTANLGNRLPFIISNNCTLRGMISAQLFDIKKPIPLVTRVYVSNEDKELILFFGQKLPYKAKHLDRLVGDFYIYRMRQGQREYLIFSLEKIRIGYYTVKGMKIDVSDETKIGENARVPTDVQIIFAYETIPDIIKITETEIWKYASSKNLEDWLYLIRGEYRQTPEFEKLLMAWLFSGSNFKDFPLHLFIVGPPGTGKSFLLDCLNSQFKEELGVFAGTTSTSYGLIPSYGGAIFQEGYLCACRRLAMVDEFLTALFRHRSIADAEDATAKMTEILEHKSRVSISGKGKIFVNPQSRAIMCMNPQNLLPTLMELSKQLNKAFLSRGLWYFQTAQHVEFIDRKKRETIDVRLKLPEQDKTFVAIVDYLQAFNLIEGRGLGDAIVKIIDDNQQHVPSELIETFYKPRAVHHIGCLLDGMAKANSLLENRGKFEITEKDINETNELFSMIVQSWSPKEPEKMPIVVRKYYLKEKDRQIYEWICQAVNPPLHDIANSFEMSEQAMRYHITNLTELGLITRVGDLFYPYWHQKAREAEASAQVFREAYEKGELKELD